MAIRLKDPPLDSTMELLALILPPMLRDSERVALLCPAGDAVKIAQRIRVAINRKRTSMRQKGKLLRQFTLRSTIHTETHNGKRMDCLVMWIEVKLTQQLSMMLDNLMKDKVA